MAAEKNSEETFLTFTIDVEKSTPELQIIQEFLIRCLSQVEERQDTTLVQQVGPASSGLGAARGPSISPYHGGAARLEDRVPQEGGMMFSLGKSKAKREKEAEAKADEEAAAATAAEAAAAELKNAERSLKVAIEDQLGLREHIVVLVSGSQTKMDVGMLLKDKYEDCWKEYHKKQHNNIINIVFNSKKLLGREMLVGDPSVRSMLEFFSNLTVFITGFFILKDRDDNDDVMKAAKNLNDIRLEEQQNKPKKGTMASRAAVPFKKMGEGLMGVGRGRTPRGDGAAAEPEPSARSAATVSDGTASVSAAAEEPEAARQVGTKTVRLAPRDEDEVGEGQSQRSSERGGPSREGDEANVLGEEVGTDKPELASTSDEENLEYKGKGKKKGKKGGGSRTQKLVKNKK